MQTLHERRVVITGATGGLGTKTVEAFLAVGARVVAVARRRTRLADLLAEHNHHPRLEIAESDVSDAAGVSALFESLGRAGPVHSVVHTVGGFAGGAHKDLSADRLASLIEQNLTSTALVMRSALELMSRSGSTNVRGTGSLVAVSSEAAGCPAPGLALYGATKASVEHLAQACATEAAPLGLRVNTLAPGTIDTPANRDAMPDADHAAWTSPTDIAKAAIWLASDESRPVSGSCLRFANP